MKSVFVNLKDNNTFAVTEDTQFILSSTNGDYQLELVFDKPNVNAEIIGVFKLTNDNKMKLLTSSLHRAPNTSCFTFIKSALFDASNFDYTGKILIKPEGKETKAYLNDKVLLIGDNTKTNSQPILEIEANDVKASHGASSGRIDESEIYYLMSRGFDRKTSENIILEGFFRELVNRIEDKKIQKQIFERLSQND